MIEAGISGAEIVERDAHAGTPQGRERVLRARELLETRDWGSDLVAAACGLGTAANLRIHFRRAVGVSPSDYRRSFAAT